MLRNYTPHRELTYRPPDGPPVRLQQIGAVRLAETSWADGRFPNGLPLTRMRYGAADHLPEREDGVVFVVSQLVVMAHPDRDDLAFPAGLTRNEQGDITGFSLLARPAPTPPNAEDDQHQSRKGSA